MYRRYTVYRQTCSDPKHSLDPVSAYGLTQRYKVATNVQNIKVKNVTKRQYSTIISMRSKDDEGYWDA